MAEDLPFRDPSLSVDRRVDDLLGRLTPDEKISLLHRHQPAVPRPGIASFRTGTEALHGVAWPGEATVFPQAVGLASAWDPELRERVGSAVAATAPGTLELRLGSPTGPLAATARTAGTGSPYTCETVTAALSGAAVRAGRTDLYLVLSEGLRLSTFSLR